MRFALVLLLALGAIGLAEDDRRMQPDHAPTPFTAEEIRAGCPSGRVSVFRVETEASPDPTDQSFVFKANTPTGASFHIVQRSLDGEEQMRTPLGTKTWEEFRRHASYPAASTTIKKGTLDTNLGKLEGMTYLVKTKGPKGEMVTRAEFATRIPGPPVRFIEKRDGKRIYSMILVRHRDGNEAALIEQMGKGRTKPESDEHVKTRTDKYFKQDKDGDGFVREYGERITSSMAMNPSIQRQFKRIDVTRDGRHSRAEVEHYYRHDNSIFAVYRAIAGEDDKLDRKTFVAKSGITDPKAAARAFAWFDRDADGNVTTLEFRTVWADWTFPIP
ncbi:MAG: hypothetical protein AAGD14_18705 [Planctomycetota bacterium]